MPSSSGTRSSGDPVAQQKFILYNLRETYHELGRYEFKVVLDPRFFKNGHMSDLSCVDSDGRPVRFTFEKWGRKINCCFTIDPTVADGVSVVKMNLKDDEGHEHTGRATFWVIKP